MQFIEWSLIGLRAARQVFRHPDHAVSVTLFPMVHIGEAAFYQTVYDDAATHDVVITEGVKSPVTRRLTRAYRWMRPEKLGLVRQPPFDNPHTRRVHGDLSGAEFDALWRQASLATRLTFETAASAFGLWQRLTATRENLGRHLNTTDVRDRDDILAWSDQTAPVFHALLAARDARLVKTLGQLIDTEPQPVSIAVIFGAGHMPGVSRSLSERGFRPVESAWITVFEA